MRPSPFLLFLTLLLIFTLCACNPVKLIESGRYDDAIEVSIRKLRGKKKKKAKYVTALEEAFHKANQRDLYRARSLEKEGDPAKWEEINALYRRILDRQARVEPLLPLYDKQGYKAEFRFVRIEDMEQRSRKEAAAYLYDKAARLLQQARRGDKEAARQAYFALEKTERYFKDYKDRQALMEEALRLGIEHVLVRVENRSPFILPRTFVDELLDLRLDKAEDFWTAFYTRPQKGIQMDYTADIEIRSIEVGPEVVNEREYIEEKEIEDGFEYVLDANGNVAKDSLGNDIKVPKKVVVKAEVRETYQEKRAVFDGRLEIVDRRTGKRIHSEPLLAEAVFQNLATDFWGDKRALSEETKDKLGYQPLPFPTDQELVMDLVQTLKPKILKALRKRI